MQFILHPKFKKKFCKLRSSIKDRFDERLGLFIKNPFDIVLENHSVDKTYPGCRSINITGDYRAIFYVKEGIAIFINIDTHSNLYR